jgi:hypothetical protein
LKIHYSKRSALKRKKIVNDIDDFLPKHSDMAFLLLTFSSVNISINDYVFSNKNHYSIENALSQAIMLLHSNRGLINSQKSIKEILLVTFVVGVDVTKNLENDFLTISNPVKIINDELKADSKKLRINL